MIGADLLISAVKKLLPAQGDYRVLWERCSPPDENKLTFSIWEIDQAGEQGKQIVSAVFEWPK